MSRKWDGLPPREKLNLQGEKSLSDAELLAIFIRTGTPTLHVMDIAEALLEKFGSLRGIIETDKEKFLKMRGAGEALWCQLQAVAELSDRFYDSNLLREERLCSVKSARRFLQGRLMRQQREVFMVIFLDNQHKVLAAEEMFAGTYNSVEVHPREIIRRALALNAAALIVAHNHPSGQPEPSRADKHITQVLKESCALFTIRLLDHLVIGHGAIVSFAERGLV